MKRWFIILFLCFGQIVLAQEKDSTSIQEVVGSFFGIEQPKIGMLAQFGTSWQVSHSAPRSSFYIGLLRLYLSGTIDKKLKYVYQGDIDYGFRTLDLKFSYMFDEHWKLDAGQFKVAFGREYLRNDAKLLFVNRSTVARRIGPFRQRGLQVNGSWFEKRLDLSAGVFNGEAMSYGDNISMFVVNGNIVPWSSIAEEPHLLLSLGGSFTYANDKYDITSVSYAEHKILWSANMRFEYENYWIESEFDGFFHKNGNWQQGCYVDLANRISNDIEVAFRFDWYRYIGDPDLGFNLFEPFINRSYILGLNWYPHHHVKLQLNIERNQTNKATTGILNLQYGINNEF